MNREGKLVKNTIILAFGTFFPKLAIFITLPVLTGYLSQTDYGTYDLVITLVALLLPAATLQIHSAAFRFLIDVQHDDNEKKSIISNIYAFVIATSVLTLLVTFFVLGDLSVGIRFAICAYFLFDIIVNANRQIARGLGRNIDYAVSSFVSSLGQILLTFLLVMGIKGGLLGGLIALSVAEIIASTYLMFSSRIYKYIDLKSLNWGKLKELLGYSWPMVPNSLSQWVMHASDKLIISTVMSVASSAVFAVAYKIPSILSFAQATFNMAWQENASIASKDEDVGDYYTSMFATLYDIVAGCLAVLIGFTPILFALFVKGDYGAAYPHIPILYMGMLFFTLSTFWGGIFVAFKKTKAVGTTTVIAAVVHLAVAIGLIYWLGLYAASIATVISYVVLCALRLLGVRKLIKISYDWKHIIIVIALLAVQCVICFFNTLPLNIINFVIGMAIGIFLNRKLIETIFKKLGKIMKKLRKKNA